MARPLSISLLLAVALGATACSDSTAPQPDDVRYDLIFESMAAPTANQSQLYLLASGATSPIPLFNGPPYAAQPRVSADGRWVAFLSPSPVNGDEVLWIARTDGSEHHEVFTSPGSVISRPAPSPDGSRIAFQMYSDDLTSSRIWVVNANGTNAHALTTAVHDGGYIYTTPSWSPDGSTLALAAGTPGNLRVGTMSADGGEVTTVTQPGSGSDTEPTWSPDGSRLAIVHTTSPAQNDLVIVTIATGQRRTLYTGNGRHPAWSPTGQLIAFSARLGVEPNELFIAPAEGGVVQRITTNDVPDRHPNWVRREP
jgi:Tol biopolymer transport system component